ncbi:MAG: hypothetical protein HYX84_05170 [Chloroflexi bacterium]|nr:hypothetical protein [Chloroflexota bacterium]
MAERFSTGFTENDIRFLVETTAPQLLGKIGTVQGDPAIIEGMLARNEDRLFEELMRMAGQGFVSRISPRFFFEVLLRRAIREMKMQTYTIERSASQRISVFDAREVTRFFDDKALIKYLADMLASFTRTESYTRPLRVRKGIWRKVRFSDLDVDSLVRLCETVDDEQSLPCISESGTCVFLSSAYSPNTLCPPFPMTQLPGRRFTFPAG